MRPVDSVVQDIVVGALREQNSELRTPLQPFATLATCGIQNGNDFLWFVRRQASMHYMLSHEDQMKLWQDMEGAMTRCTYVDDLLKAIATSLELMLTTG